MTIYSFIQDKMVIERLIGVMIYACTLFIFYYGIRYSYSRKKTAGLLNIYVIILSIMAFIFIPEKTTDLYRLLEISKNWPNMKFNDFITQIAFKSNVPVAYIYIYICRCTGLDGFLPMMTCFIFYSNVFSILKSLQKKFNIESKQIAIAMLSFMAMGKFLEVISGVRTLMAAAIFARCLYYELTNHKINLTKTIIIYLIELITCLIHPYILILFLMKLILSLFKREQKKSVKILNTCIVIIVCAFTIIYGKNYIKEAIEKAKSYLFEDHYSYIWEYIIAGLQCLTIGYSLIFFLKNRKLMNYKIIDKNTYFNIFIFVSMFFIVALVFCYQYSIFHRTITFVSILTMPLICFNLKEYSSKKYEETIIGISLLALILACTRGDLCAYKFFIL